MYSSTLIMRFIKVFSYFCFVDIKILRKTLTISQTSNICHSGLFFIATIFYFYDNLN